MVGKAALAIPKRVNYELRICSLTFPISLSHYSVSNTIKQRCFSCFVLFLLTNQKLLGVQTSNQPRLITKPDDSAEGLVTLRRRHMPCKRKVVNKRTYDVRTCALTPPKLLDIPSNLSRWITTPK